jgi:teichoic acid transport system ATP-binding protein
VADRTAYDARSVAEAAEVEQDGAATTHVAPPVSQIGVRKGVVMIRAEDVHVRYRVYQDVNQSLRAFIATGGRGRRFVSTHAIRGITFDAHAGESIGVIGANGSGKTTLMRAISGLLPVNEGAVYARATPMLLGVGAVLNKSLSGRRNILLGGLALGLTKEEVLEREAEVIEFAGIGDAIDLPMKTYSSGMSARLQFAISAAVKPEILIIDEALSVGDKDFKARSQQKIAELHESAGVVFLVSHGMGSIRRNCNRVLWLHQGKLMMDGDPEEVIEAYMSSDIKTKANEPDRVEKRKRKLLKQKSRAERKLRKLESQQAAASESRSDASED